MKHLKDIPTYILVELSKGLWHLHPGINSDFITKEMQEWLDNSRKLMCEEFKAELKRRSPVKKNKFVQMVGRFKR